MSVIEAPAPARTEVTTRDVLHRAADLLEEFGWCQGTLGSKNAGAMCALGAIVCADHDLEPTTTGWREAERIVSIGLRPVAVGIGAGQPCPLAGWNDAPERTKEEVVARLREAAENA